MTGITEVASNTVNAMSKAPVLLALLIFNLIILGAVFYIVSGQSEHYDTVIKALLDACKH